MITLYRKKSSDAAEELQSKLNDLILAFRVESLPERGTDEFYIVESGKRITGDEEINKWFVQLESELKWQRSLSGDGCYIDPNTGHTC